MILKVSVAVLILCEAIMLGMLGNTIVVPILVMLATGYLFYRPIQLDVPLLIKILVPAFLVVYFAARYMTIPPLETRSEWVFPSKVTVALAECFLLGQIFELIKRRDPEDGLLNFCLLAMAVVVCCCSRNAIGSQRSLLFIGSVISITLICTIFQYSTRTFVAADESHKPDLAYRFTLISITIGAIGFSSWYFSGSLRDNIEGFQNWWMQNVRVSGLRMNETSIGFSDEATLQNITALKNSNPLNPVLRVYSDNTPGYMRGHAFDIFTGAEWKKSKSPKSKKKPIQPPANLGLIENDLYPINPAPPERSLKLEISNQGGTPHLFLPLNTNYLAGSSPFRPKQLVMDSNQSILRGIVGVTSYSAFLYQTPPRLQIQPAQQKILTEIPESIEDGVKTIARQTTRGDQSDAARISSIEQYFNDNFNYSRTQENFPPGRDQLSYFVLEQRPAHCEFFASAAVVFLRANGIPARYVTGFATTEKSTEEEYFVARNQDAHAWAEAYDRDRQTWVVVEATPGSDFPKSPWDDSSDEDVNLEGGASDLESDDVGARWTNFLVAAWLQVRVFFEEIGRQLRGPINIAIVSVILFSVFYRYWWKPLTNPYYRTREGQLEKERIKVEKLLSRIKLHRQSNETMFQFEDRIRRECDSTTQQRIQEVLTWFRAYESIRFGSDSDGPIPEAPSQLLPVVS